MKFKGLLLFIMIITLSLLFSAKSYAAELYGVNVYIFHDLYNNGTLQEEQAQQYSNYYSSSSPITVYLMDRVSAPSSTYVSIGYYVVSDSPIYNVDGVECSETFSDSNGNVKYLENFSYDRSYVRPFSADIYMISTGAENAIMLKQYYSLEDFLTNYLSGTLDYDIEIDWENAQYNESIGYLQNVMLKATDLKEMDFEITWANNNGQYMSDDWRIQIGWNTRYQKELFGSVYNWTNLEYVTWSDELYYSSGKWDNNFITMYSEIPECEYESWWGMIYLRIVHVDSSTGQVEYGGWGQISWQHKNDLGLTAYYKTVSDSNVFNSPFGSSDSFSVEYTEDTTSETSQSYAINVGSGTIDSVSTSLINGTLDENGNIDIEKASNYFISGMTNLMSNLDSFPQMFGKVFSFLPSELTVLIGLAIAISILLRIGGR